VLPINTKYFVNYIVKWHYVFGSTMTIPEEIVALLPGGKPGAFCDDCISSGLHLPRRQEVAIVTLTLSWCTEFQRAQGSCAAKKHIGVQEKLVVQAL
jgi:hypothetical protein